MMMILKIKLFLLKQQFDSLACQTQCFIDLYNNIPAITNRRTQTGEGGR